VCLPPFTVLFLQALRGVGDSLARIGLRCDPLDPYSFDGHQRGLEAELAYLPGTCNVR